MNLVIGNATIDGILSKDVLVEIKEHSIVLKHGGKTIKVTVKDGPIRPGGKYTANTDFYRELQSFPRTEQFGGGGYLSAATLSRISNGSVCYLDISTPSLDTSIPGASLANRLHSMDIHPYFLSARPMPFNLVLGNREDKIIVKGRISAPIMGGYHNHLINDLVNDCDGLLFNSLKDKALVESALKKSNSGRTLIGVITNSLEPDFVMEKVIPYCTCQFNYDEFGYIANPDHTIAGNEETRIEGAFEGMKRIRIDHNPHNHMYVTLGKNGVLCCNDSVIYHVRFKDEILDRIQYTVKNNPISTCGAGDAHAASILNDESLGLPVKDIAQRACINAVRYLGHKGEIDQEDFIVVGF